MRAGKHRRRAKRHDAPPRPAPSRGAPAHARSPSAVLIPDDDGYGMKVMTVAEFTDSWKRNDDYPDCLACGSLNTREHHFIQTWCRSAKHWTSETLCLDCQSWSWRSYCDPEYMTSEDHEKLMWEKMVRANDAHMVEFRDKMPK